MRLKQYKEQAAKMLDVPNSMPVSEMLDLAKQRYRVLFERPSSKLDQAKLLHSISQLLYRRGKNTENNHAA